MLNLFYNLIDKLFIISLLYFLEKYPKINNLQKEQIKWKEEIF